jgi:hypothetical protein
LAKEQACGFSSAAQLTVLPQPAIPANLTAIDDPENRTDGIWRKHQ